MKKILLFIRNLFKKSGVYYVGKTDVLPPPLSKEEEDYLCGLSEKGDLKARNKLIEHNLRLVVFLAKKYENTKVDLEDLVSIGSIGLIKGVNTFSKDKNIKLATYCSRCIDNEILMHLRKNKKIDNVNGKSKITAGILGIFLGCYGVHNFYLGYNGKAIAQLLITLLSLFLLSWVSAIWGLIEGILILTGNIKKDASGNDLID